MAVVRLILRLSSSRPRPLAAVPALLRLVVVRSSPSAQVPRKPLCYAEHQGRDGLGLPLQLHPCEFESYDKATRFWPEEDVLGRLDAVVSPLPVWPTSLPRRSPQNLQSRRSCHPRRWYP